MFQCFICKQDLDLDLVETEFVVCLECEKRLLHLEIGSSEYDKLIEALRPFAKAVLDSISLEEALNVEKVNNDVVE